MRLTQALVFIVLALSPLSLFSKNFLPIKNSFFLNTSDSIFLHKNIPSFFLFTVNTFNTTCGRAEGGIAVRVTNGVAPYRYKLNGPYNFDWRDNGLFGNLPPGSYKVYAKDAADNIDSVDAVITNTSSSPSLVLPLNYLIFPCNGTLPSYTVSASGGQPPYLYSYDFINFQNSPVFTNLYKGLYNFGVKDANGCISVQYQILSPSNCRFSYGMATAGSVCENTTIGSFTSSYNGATNPRRCMISADGAPEVLNATAYGPGLHLFHIRDTVTNDTTNFRVSTLKICQFTLEANLRNADCHAQNGTIKFIAKNGTPPYMFSMNGFDFSVVDSFYNLKPGTYTCAVKDSTQKIAFCIVEIGENCPQITDSSIVPTNCGLSNGSITVWASGGILPYVYSIDGANFQVSNTFNGLASGSYVLTIRDANGFKDSSLLMVQNGRCMSVLLSVSDASCMRSGSISALASGGTFPYLYSIDSVVFQISNTFTNLDAGNYTVFVKDANGVTISKRDTIKGPHLPLFNLGNDTLYCGNNQIKLSPNIKYPGASYQWSTNQITDSIIVVSSGDYWLKVTDTYGCVWKDTVHLTIKNLPAFNLGNDTAICLNDTLSLDAYVTNAEAYLWSNNATDSLIKVWQPDTYWCIVTKEGCTYKDSLVLNVKPLPIVNLGADTSICENGVLLLNANNNNSTYTWQDNSTGSTYTVRRQGMYTVEVKKEGCIESDTINVIYVPKPHFSLGNDKFLCSGESFILRPFLDSSWLLSWQDNSSSASYIVTRPGVYSLTAQNSCGSRTEEITISEGLCDVYIPTAFAPFGAEVKNRLFRVSGTASITFFDLQIYNRFGNIVFQTKNKHAGWDGTYRGDIAELGTYVYLLNYKDSKGTHFLKGSFLLLR